MIKTLGTDNSNKKNILNQFETHVNVVTDKINKYVNIGNYNKCFALFHLYKLKFSRLP